MRWRALSTAVESLARDVEYGVRVLLKQRTFTVTAALTLALGVGASTALFTLVRNVLLRPLAIPDAHRVVLVYNSYPKASSPHVGAGGADYVDRLAGVPALEEQSLFSTYDPTVEVENGPERVHAMHSTASFFRIVRVAPQYGRAFTTEEETAGRNRVVVLGSGLAQRIFGVRDPIGRRVRIDGEPHEVVGVMPPSFAFVDAAVQLWVPLTLTDHDKDHTHANNWLFIGRLRAGATIEQAQSQIDAVNAMNLDRFPESRSLVIAAGFHSVVVRLQDDLVREIRPTLRLLWGGALFVLLIGALNVGSLVLARSQARAREFATRTALGAAYSRLARQLVVEHVVLALASGVPGLIVAVIVLQFAGHLPAEHLPKAAPLHVDGVVILFTIAVTAIVGAALGLIPVAVGLPRRGLLALGYQSRSTTPRSRALRRTLVVVQISTAFVLLVGAGLLTVTLRRAASVDLGYSTDHILTASVSLPAARYGDPQAKRAFVDGSLDAIRSVPGVVSAGVTSAIPLGTDYGMTLILAEGYRPPPGEAPVGSWRNAVTPGFFETMGARLTAGRLFDDRDTAGAPRTIVVDTRLARRFWPDQDPIGRSMHYPQRKDPYVVADRSALLTVVGVVDELKARGALKAGGAIGAFYLPYAQAPAAGLTFAVRTVARPEAIAAALRSAVQRVDPQIPLYDVQTMTERASGTLEPQRLQAWVATGFGVVALALCAIGLYGVLAYLVVQRTREIAVRIALGSTQGGVFRLVLREGVVLIAVGFVLGLAGVAALGGYLQAYLFGVRASNPAILLLVGAGLGAISVFACAVPARRAARINPVAALAEP